MPWSTLPTLSDGGTPTASDFNKYKGNLDYLHSQRSYNYEYSGTTNFTTTSTNWGTISSDFAGTIVTSGGHLLALFSGVINQLELDISLNGTRLCSTSAAGTGSARCENSAYTETYNLPVLYANLPAGTYVVAAQWKATSGTGTLDASYRPRFHAREL